MTCRHADPVNDPNCSSYCPPAQQMERLRKSAEAIGQKFGVNDQDNSRFEILDMLPFSVAMVLRVKYESCPKCSFEGVKVLVYEGVSTIDVVRWRVIDPISQTFRRPPAPMPPLQSRDSRRQNKD